ncbi:hypothetical protein K439DRAFT_1405472 [Ramaria rubella]|nr:hypothetical protein K439DRAFT_1405472 [Ramaria rubella]
MAHHNHASAQMPMSPNEETPTAPLAAITHLQPEEETVQKDTSNTGPIEENKKTSAATPQATAVDEKDGPITAEPGIAPVEDAVTQTIAPIEEIAPAPAVDSKNTPVESKTTGIVVHHLNDSRSQRLLWLLEELEIPYEIKKYQRTAEMRAPKNLKDIHPLGKSPIITDGEVTLAESGAITEYLIVKYGTKFHPIESGKIDNLYFTHYAEGSFMPILVNKYIFSLIPQRSPALLRPLIKSVFSTLEKKMLNPELTAHCNIIEAHLEKSKTGWFAGGDHPTSADFMMAFALEALVHGGVNFAGPKIKEYVKRVHERPAYKRGIEKGGKYVYA